jgi:hypothetical protein
MNDPISKAVSGGLSKEDAEYIYSLDDKTKREALSFLNSANPGFSFGHWGTRCEHDLSEIMDGKLRKIIIDITNLNQYPLLTRMFFGTSFMKKGFKKIIFSILSYPAIILPSPATKIETIKELLGK